MPGISSSAKHSPDELPSFFAALPVHEVRALAGIDVAGLRTCLEATPPPSRPIIGVDLVGGTVDDLRRSALRQIATAVDDLWPFAWGGEDFAAARGDALTLAHLPLRIAALADRVPGLSQTWARGAVEARLRGRGSGVDAPAEMAWEQLCLMLSPGGLTMVTDLDLAREPGPFVGAVEWLAAHASVGVAVLSNRLPPPSPPWSRILHGAWTVETRLTATQPLDDPAGFPLVVALPEVQGRPHPLSAVELRLFRHVQGDTELQPLFGFNLLVDEADLLHAKVDLLWRAGRVVVEVDGDEHRGAARYRADRERDHRLMCAGYRVLRLTNDEVAEDGARAVEKIREVVRLAKGERG